MVTQDDDSQESRPPTLEDLLTLCQALNAKKAKYLIIGGMAMIQHGFVRATEDIDLLVDSELKNEKIVFDVLSKLPDGAAKELKAGDLAQYEVIRVADEIVIDVMNKASGIDFDNASSEILKVKIRNVEIPFASVDLLIRMKQSVREKDRLDLEFLKNLKKGTRIYSKK